MFKNKHQNTNNFSDLKKSPGIFIGLLIFIIGIMLISAGVGYFYKNDDLHGVSLAQAITEADLSLDTGGNPTEVLAGTSTTYSSTVTNNGPATATSVILTINIPDGTSYVSSTSSQGSCSFSIEVGVVTCRLGNIEPSRTASADVIISTPSTSSDGIILTSYVDVHASESDPLPEDNSSTIISTVRTNADLEVSATTNTIEIRPGDTYTYSVTTTNNGPSIASNVHLSVLLPEEVTFISVNTPLGTCTENSRTVSCDFTQLDYQERVTIEIVVRIPEALQGGTILILTTTIESETIDPVPLNSTINLPVEILPPLIGCTYTSGYWKNHAGISKKQPDVITQFLPISLGGGGGKTLVVTTANQAYSILNVDNKNSKGIKKLYAQLLTAKLNISNGASNEVISSTLNAVDAFLTTHDASDWDTLSKTEKNQVISWVSTLANYNNGLSGVPHC